MERREFLRVGTMAGAGAVAVGSSGCAGLGVLAPPVIAFSPADMQKYLDRLDHSMSAVSTTDAVAGMLPADVKNPFAASDPEFRKGDLLFRKTVRSLLLAGSFHDLSEEDRMHPGMQERMWRSLGEMDDSMLGMNDMMANLTPTERADMARALRDDPDLGMRVVETLDAEGVKAGVPLSRRLQMRAIAVEACARLKQSPSLFIDEYNTKVRKIAARQGSIEEAERRMAARMGEEAFFAYRDQMIESRRRWDVALAATGTATDAPPTYGPPAYASPPREAGLKRGTVVIIVGASLLGVGAITAGIGAAVGGAGVYAITAGAIIGLGGLITLIVGIVQRATA
ncbi:hypothetical protein [Sorangium cellulosum]|uniref:hypothetical protein n=1 Tax=Sorangium cellulosum TaxID=56 RepID=UPI0002D3E3CD|nr:hypothetical protein [Sorangium cellulosum]